MRQCPACGNTYPDDANFCPMDATRLSSQPAAVVDEGPPTTQMPVAANESSATMLDGGPTNVAGRYLVSPQTRATPTGTEAEAHDTQTGGGAVRLKLVPPSVLPTPAMADRALRELKQLAKVQSE